MKVYLGEISKKKKEFVLAGSSWIPEDVLLAARPVQAVFSLRRKDAATVHLHGHLALTVRLPCDRCGEEALAGIDEIFVYHLSTVNAESSVGEQEVDDEASFHWPLSGPYVDVDAIFREQLLLSLPVKVLCTAQCRGLCPGCGATLNSEDCRCSFA